MLRRSSSPLILFYSPGWIRTAEWRLCDGCCSISLDRRRLRDADAVVFHIPTTREMPLRKRRHQLWVAWSAESDVNYPQLADPSFMARFDLTVTYRTDSDVVLAYAGPEHLSALGTPPRVKRETAPAVYFASSGVDRSGRTAYVRELMEVLPVDSYGASLRNRDLRHDDGRATKLETIARYRFTLAFENSIAPDYVTEKFYDPLVAGSVPVYLGAPNVQDFAPGRHCFVDVSDFASPRELARYLHDLVGDEARYQEYLAWKREPLDPAFVARAEEQRTPAICRLCDVVTRAWRARRR